MGSNNINEDAFAFLASVFDVKSQVDPRDARMTRLEFENRQLRAELAKLKGGDNTDRHVDSAGLPRAGSKWTHKSGAAVTVIGIGRMEAVLLVTTALATPLVISRRDTEGSEPSSVAPIGWWLQNHTPKY